MVMQIAIAQVLAGADVFTMVDYERQLRMSK